MSLLVSWFLLVGSVAPAAAGVGPAEQLQATPEVQHVPPVTDSALVDLLRNDSLSTRVAAAWALAQRGARVRPRLLILAGDQEQPSTVRAWAMVAVLPLWDDQVRQTCLALLRDDNDELVCFAAAGLGRYSKSRSGETEDHLLRLLGDARPRVRRAVALALGQVGSESSADALISALRFDDGHDPRMREALSRGLEQLGPMGIERLIALAQTDREQDRAIAVHAYATLESLDSYNRLPQLLANPHLSDEQVAALLRSYGNYRTDPLASLEPVVDWLLAHGTAQSECKLAALGSLRAAPALNMNKTGSLLLRMIAEETEPEVRLQVLQLVRLAQLQAAVKPLIALLGARGRPAAEERSIVVTLSELGARDAIPLLKSLAQSAEAKTLHEEAWRALAILMDPDEASGLALNHLRGQGPSGVTLAALELAGRTSEGARIIGSLFVEGRIPSGAKAVVEHALVRALARLTGAQDHDRSELKRLLELVRSRSDGAQPNSPPEADSLKRAGE